MRYAILLQGALIDKTGDCNFAEDAKFILQLLCRAVAKSGTLMLNHPRVEGSRWHLANAVQALCSPMTPGFKGNS